MSSYTIDQWNMLGVRVFFAMIVAGPNLRYQSLGVFKKTIITFALIGYLKGTLVE